MNYDKVSAEDLDLLKIKNEIDAFDYIKINIESGKQFVFIKSKKVNLTKLSEMLRKNNYCYAYWEMFKFMYVFSPTNSNYHIDVDGTKRFITGDLDRSNIEHIIIRYLFGYIKYDLELDDRIFVIHAPNGYGKSTLLNALRLLVECKLNELIDFPFQEISIVVKKTDEIISGITNITITNIDNNYYCYTRETRKDGFIESYLKITKNYNRYYFVLKTTFIHNYDSKYLKGQKSFAFSDKSLNNYNNELFERIKLFNKLISRFTGPDKTIVLESNFKDTEECDYANLYEFKNKYVYEKVKNNSNGNLTENKNNMKKASDYFDKNYNKVIKVLKIKENIKITNNIEPLIKNKNILDKGDRIKFEKLSDGEKYICYLLSRLIFNNSVGTIIIDEPELYLHVEWQQTLIDSIVEIKEFLEKNNIKTNIIISTHSPYIINSPYVKVGGPKYER